MEKNGFDIFDGRGPGFQQAISAAELGDAVGWTAKGGFAGSQASSLKTGYISRRMSDAGWLTDPILPPVDAGHTLQGSTVAFASDLSSSFVASTEVLAAGAVEGAGNLYRRDTDSGALELMATSDNAAWMGAVVSGGTPVIAATPRPGTTVLFQPPPSSAPLLPEAEGAGPQLYGYDDGEVSLISRGLDGEPLPSGVAPPGSINQPLPAVSDDGERIYFQGQGNAIYLREGGETVASITTYQTDPNLPPRQAFAPYFLGATPDGRFAYFSTEDSVTSESVSAGSGDAHLYRYDAETDSLTDLTPNYPGGAFVNQVALTVSADGERFYFRATGELAPGAVAGQINTFLMDGEAAPVLVSPSAAISTATGTADSMAASPSGRYLAFESTAQETTDDTGGKRAVYVYDAVEDELRCASCVAGGLPSDDAHLGGSGLGPFVNKDPLRRVLDDGSVFFDSRDGLVSRDSNGRYDVYRYRSGEVELISSGGGSSDTYFRDSTADGKSVYIATRNRLVGQDRDDLIDLYVARVDGGVGSQFPATAESGCAGDACQGAVSSISPFGLPGSAVLSGRVGEPGPRRGLVAVRPSRSALSRAGRSGRLVVPVRTTGGGRVAVAVSARIGGRWRLVGRASRSAPGGEQRRMLVGIGLSRAARRTLRRDGRLAVRVRVSLSGRGSEGLRLTLTRKGR